MKMLRARTKRTRNNRVLLELASYFIIILYTKTSRSASPNVLSDIWMLATATSSSESHVRQPVFLMCQLGYVICDARCIMRKHMNVNAILGMLYANPEMLCAKTRHTHVSRLRQRPTMDMLCAITDFLNTSLRSAPNRSAAKYCLWKSWLAFRTQHWSNFRFICG